MVIIILLVEVKSQIILFLECGSGVKSAVGIDSRKAFLDKWKGTYVSSIACGG